MAGRSHHDARVHRALAQIQAQSEANSVARSVARLEDRIADQHREIQALLLDNQRLAATHVALKQDVAASHQELRHLSATASAVRAESDAQVREVYEKALRLEAEANAVSGYGEKLTKVKEDVMKLGEERKELEAELKGVEEELAKAKAELKQFPGIKAEIEDISKEIELGSAAIEHEKKISATNMENSRIMEESMISMAREIDKLNVELANAEKRARAAAATVVAAPSNSVYPAGYAMPDHGYGGHLYSASLAVPQVQSAGDLKPQYGHGTMPHGMHGHY
ncbi:hypothetical protein LIER_20364 [Lithospermum erythrorhizon]|uniref:Protein FLC EXPRESSOR n=1 Tax=Lithospermum erythrorhizon TaxID=34254 RepID=A0AAV3QNP2_LITER